MPEVMEKQRVFLLPGEFSVARKPTLLSTILGSCVSLCIHDTRTGYGGMNHFLLPQAPLGETPSPRYGNVATKTLLDAMLRIGSKKSDLVVHIIGGGNVVEHLTSTGASVGGKNILTAVDFCQNEGLTVKSRDIGGDRGRKVHFHTGTGELDVRKTQRSEWSQKATDRAKVLRTRKTRVLVVDDSQTVLSVLRRIIETDDSFEVVGQAKDAYEARDMVVEFDPDVLTLDIIMPKMDGLQFLRRLNKYHPKPVIVLSTIAKAGSAVASRARTAGAFDVIDKETLQLYGDRARAKAVLLPKLKAAAASGL